MGKRYIVTAPYIYASTADPISGKRVKLGWYAGQLLPADITDDEITHHLGTKQIEEVKLDSDGTLQLDPEVATGLADPGPNGADVTDGLGEPNKGPGATADGSGDVSDPADRPQDSPREVVAGDDVPEPKKSDKRELWVDYAVSKGADREDIEENQVTKADLIATHGSR